MRVASAVKSSFLRAAAMAAFVASTAVPVAAGSGSGAYLAARHAASANDFEAAAQYLARALVHYSDDPALLESAALTQLALGRMSAAVPIAQRLESLETSSQVAHMIVTADLIESGEYALVTGRAADDKGIGPLVDGLIEAWAEIGGGSVARAMDRFDSVSQERGLRGFALYHKALALAMVGDFEGAQEIFEGPDANSIVITRRGAMAHAEILSQLGRNDDALGLLSEAFGGLDPELAALTTALDAGEAVPFSHVTGVNDGLAEVFYSIAAALRSEASPEYALMYARTAAFLRPDHVDAILLSAEILDEMDQYDLAIATYKLVPDGHGAHHAAELGRAGALRASDRMDAAREVLEQLARDYPDNPVVHSTLGDLLRQQEDFQGAIAAYDAALALTDDGARAQWFLFYARGISHERLDQWPEAEADFRSALKLNPEQPQVLNYLGYSMVEKRINLDEALSMIERAVAARPDSGYIVDSLGWVLYRLGHYRDAVPHMERAVALEATDPIVNDRLGDVYWAVGRKREAEFQWHRALSFDPEEEEADRIRRKLEVGLDQVLEEEGEDPIDLANDQP